MHTKIVRSLVASAVTVLLIFSQTVLAGYECQFTNPASSLSNMSDMPDCMNMNMNMNMNMKMEKATPSVTCTAHCEKNAQIGSPSTNLPTPAFSLIAWLHPLPALMTVTTTDVVIYAAVDPPLISPATPLRIQYQVFRI